MPLGQARAMLAIAAAATLASLAYLPAGAQPEGNTEQDAGRLHIIQRDDTEQLDVHVFIPYRAETPGLAHYVEHLAWLSATRDWARNGRGRTGAWTNSHALHYWISARNGSIDELVETIGGVFGPIALTEQYALSERDIILREYREWEAEYPLHSIFEQTDAELYSNNPAAVPVLGEPEDIRALDLAQALRLHSDTHSASDAAFLVEGNVSEDAVYRALSELGFSETGANSGTVNRPRFDLASEKRIVTRLARGVRAPHAVWRRVVRLEEETPYEVLASRTELLGMILSTNRPGGLVKALQFDQAVARSLSIWLHAIDEQHAELSIVGHPDRGMTLNGLVDAFEQALSQTASAGIPRTTYDQIVQQHARQWPDWESRSEVSEYMRAIALERLSVWRPPPDEETIRRLDGQLPLSAIDELLRQLAGEGRTVVALVDTEKAAE